MSLHRQSADRVIRGAVLGVTGAGFGWVLSRITGFDADPRLVVGYFVALAIIGAVLGWLRP